MNLKSAVSFAGVIFVRILARDPDKNPVAILIAGRNAKRRPIGGGSWPIPIISRGVT